MNDDLISRQAALVSIKNLYPDMPVVDIFSARRKWLEKYAPYFECENAIEQLPSVNPQEPKTDVLDKIRAEIDSHCSDNRDRNDGLYIAMKIIDKYRAESEE